MKNKFEAVIFDLDGTLLNTLQDIADSVNSVLNRYDHPTHKLDDYRIFVGAGVRKLVERAFPEDIFHDGVHELLSALSEFNISMSICTNKPQLMAEKTIHTHLSEWMFDHVIGIDNSTPAKPHPVGVNRIIESQSIVRNKFLFVGDSDTDMATAQNARISGIGVSWGFRKKQELIKSSALAVIDHPLELLEYFDSIA